MGIGSRVGLGKVGSLAQQVGVQLLAEGGISGLGEERLLLKDGQQSHGLLKHVDTLLEIHTEVNVGPVETLLDVFLLLKGEHVLVEELLQLLVDVVNTDLLKAIVVKDLKSGNVKHTNVLHLLHGGVNQGLVTLVNHNSEGTLIDGTSNTGHRVGGIGTGGALLHPLGTDLQLGLAEVGDHPLAVNLQESGNLLTVGVVLDLSLLFLAHGHKVLGHVAHVHHAGSVLEHIVLLLLREAKDVKGLVGVLHVLPVVDGGDSELALGDIPVVQDVIAKEALLLEVGHLVGHDVVEGVVASLQGLLVGQSGLLQQVHHHVSARQLARGVEVDTDEFTKSGGVVVSHSLGVAPGLQYRVGLDNLVLKGGLALLLLARGADGGKVGDDLLGVLSLAGAGLTGDKDGLVAARVHHALVGALSNGENVGRALVTPLTGVDLHGAEGVDGEPLVGVDGNTEETGVGVDELVLVPAHRVPQDAGIAEEGEVGHVVGAIELGGVDLAHLVLLEHLGFAVDLDGDLGTVLGLQHTLKVAAIGLVVHPHRLLGVVGLDLVLGLDLVGDAEPGAGIRVGAGGLLDMAGHVSKLIDVRLDEVSTC